MSFRPTLPAVLPEVAALGRRALGFEGDDVAVRFERACAGGPGPRAELVVAAWAFDTAVEQVLLVDHARFGVLVPPGGRVDATEDPRAAVLRELQEETGLAGTLRDDRPALLDLWQGTTAEGEAIESYGLSFVVAVDPDAALVGEAGQPVLWAPLAVRPERAHPIHWRRVGDAAARLRGE